MQNVKLKHVVAWGVARSFWAYALALLLIGCTHTQQARVTGCLNGSVSQQTVDSVLTAIDSKDWVDAVPATLSAVPAAVCVLEALLDDTHATSNGGPTLVGLSEFKTQRAYRASVVLSRVRP